MNRMQSLSSQHLTRAALFLAACLAFSACKNGGDSGAQPAGPLTTTSTQPDPEATAEAKPEDAPIKPAPTTQPEEPAAAVTPTPSADPAPVADPAPPAVVDDGTSPLPTQIAAGDIVRTTKERTPEHMIQQVLVAALEPDEEKGWQLFKSLLHTDELHPNGLITRRSMNFAASRRKVHLFIADKGDLPVFKVSRILDEGDGTLRFFVHNPESMPTPCTARVDANLTPPAWRVGLCSL